MQQSGRFFEQHVQLLNAIETLHLKISFSGNHPLNNQNNRNVAIEHTKIFTLNAKEQLCLLVGIQSG